MTKIGYARVSTFEQGLDLQIAALKAAGCDVVRSEKRSGTSTAGRDQLRKAEGLGATEIAKRLGVGRASVYRVLQVASEWRS